MEGQNPALFREDSTTCDYAERKFKALEHKTIK
jgi:hypothetical protein